jgi:hypothetical protein
VAAHTDALATFLTADPVLGVAGGPVATFNPYNDVRANPVNLTDPSGQLAPLAVAALGSAVIGGAAALAKNFIDPLRSNGNQWCKIDWGQTGRSALLGAGIGVLAGTTLGAVYLAAKPFLIPAATAAASQNPDRVQDVVEVVGDVGKAVGDAITHALTSGASSPIQGALSSAASNTVHLIPRLTQGDGGTMFHQAMGFLKELPQDATIRAEWFDVYT